MPQDLHAMSARLRFSDSLLCTHALRSILLAQFLCTKNAPNHLNVSHTLCTRFVYKLLQSSEHVEATMHVFCAACICEIRHDYKPAYLCSFCQTEDTECCSFEFALPAGAKLSKITGLISVKSLDILFTSSVLMIHISIRNIVVLKTEIMIHHSWDSHSISLTYPPIYYKGLKYCEICKLEVNPEAWLYRCSGFDQCFRSLCIRQPHHLKLGNIVDPLTQTLHEHNLTIKLMDKDSCRLAVSSEILSNQLRNSQMLSLPECNRPTSLMVVAALLGVLAYALTVTGQEVSVSCMMAYDEGGAPAVFQSPECPQWVLPAEILQNQTNNCEFATIQGYRDYQEDRVTCNLDFKIPVLGKNGPKEIVVGVLAIFDGHGGKEASEMSSKYLLDYFLLHVIFCTYKQSILLQNQHGSVSQGKNNTENDISTLKSSEEVLPLTDDLPIYKILKEALLGAIHDIDMKFSLEALDNNYVSGSTATVVLLLDGTFLTANLGDSKALLCSFEDHPVKLWANELTKDHHPSRDDEKARIEAAGGFVRVWGVPRVNGVLAVSRSIGDIYLKRYGVIATPEVRDWDSLKSRDMYLVVASDGIFETLTSQDVCELLEETEASDNLSPSSSSFSLADRLVYSALRKGSTDNLSVIVKPLWKSHKSEEYAGD